MVWMLGLVVVIVAAFVVLVLRGRSTAPAAVIPVGAAGPPPVDEPMTGLESALAQVSDRSGRPLREHIDAEQQHVDQLRVPDDTGPLLRRALDHIERHGTAQHGTAQHGTAQHGTAQHGTDQHGTDQHGTDQHGTEHHGTGPHGAGADQVPGPPPADTD